MSDERKIFRRIADFFFRDQGKMLIDAQDQIGGYKLFTYLADELRRDIARERRKIAAALKRNGRTPNM